MSTLLPVDTSNYINPQLSGPYATAMIQGAFQVYSQYLPAIQYFYNLSIDTAATPELFSIATYLGIGWPSYTGFVNPFAFGDSATFPVVNYAYGFGDSSNPNTGGVFIDANGSGSALIPSSELRQLLKAIAKTRQIGQITVQVIDEIIMSILVTGTYTMNWVTGSSYSSGDITVDISMSANPSVNANTVYIIQTVFNAICTSPYVTISLVA
jgi:hypothetical protein